MARNPALIVLFLLSAAGAQNPAEYKIGAGDLLSITVFGEEDLSLKQIRVSGSGAISVPLLGEVTVSGLTSAETENLIKKMLMDGYLRNPEVTVAIFQYRMFYVHGEVKKPGGYPYVEGLTVERAIALAGGLTHRASERKIRLQKEKSAKGEVEKAEMNALVSPGDIIMVGESIF